MSENTDSQKLDAVEHDAAVEQTSTDAVSNDAVEVEAAPEEVKPAAKEKPAAKAAPTAPAPSRYAVVGGGETDAVMLSRCVFKNPAARKSLTVHHLQRRLVELGYHEADADKDGWYGDLTRNAVAAFQRDRGFDGEGLMNEQTLLAIFDGDANVTVVID
jgi:hypothetical protein